MRPEKREEEKRGTLQIEKVEGKIRWGDSRGRKGYRLHLQCQQRCCDRKLLRLRFCLTLITLAGSFQAVWFMDHWSGSLRIHSGALLFTFSGCCPNTFMHPDRLTNTWDTSCLIKYLLSCWFHLFLFYFYSESCIIYISLFFFSFCCTASLALHESVVIVFIQKSRAGQLCIKSMRQEHKIFCPWEHNTNSYNL